MEIREDTKEISLNIVGEIIGIFINGKLIHQCAMKNKSFQNERIGEVEMIIIKDNSK